MKRILSLLAFTLVFIIFLSSCSTSDPTSEPMVDGGSTSISNGEEIEQTENNSDDNKVTKNPVDGNNSDDNKVTKNPVDGNNSDDNEVTKPSVDGNTGDDPYEVDVEVSVPLHVDQGSQFEITLEVKNNTSKEQSLKKIKIDQEYLDAVAIIKTEPNYKNVFNSRFSNQKIYDFQFPLGSNEKTKFTFEAEAIKKGRYIPNFDIDTSYESLHKEVNAFID